LTSKFVLYTVRGISEI